MNKKLSLIILFLLLISLISVLLAFMAYSQGENNKDVESLKTGYEQLTKQVNELKVTTDELDTRLNQNNSEPPNNPIVPTNPNPNPTPNPNSNPNPNPNPNPNQNPLPAPNQSQNIKTITGSNVNMRAIASKNGKVVRQLSKGEKVTLTGQTIKSSGYQWVQIKDSKGNITTI